MKNLFLLLLASFGSHIVEASPRRLQKLIVNNAKVTRISMVRDLVTSIEFPCAVKGGRVGLPDQYRVVTPSEFSNELVVKITDQHARPTNLIVKCAKQRFVFDLVPTKHIHQDLVEVIASYGAPRLSTAGAKRVVKKSANWGK